MDGKSRVFKPEAEKVWHEDYQCEYYRGVIIDGEDNIVERCAKMHPNYTAAFSDAVEKMSVSPLYSRQTSPDMKKKLEEYKAKKALEKKMKTTVIFDPREWNEWKYIRARIVVAVALHEIDNAPDTKPGSKCYNKGLQNVYCAIEKCHK